MGYLTLWCFRYLTAPAFCFSVSGTFLIAAGVCFRAGRYMDVLAMGWGAFAFGMVGAVACVVHRELRENKDAAQ